MRFAPFSLSAFCIVLICLSGCAGSSGSSSSGGSGQTAGGTPSTVPQISSLSPSTIVAGSAVQLTVAGTNFVSGAVVMLDGAAMPTTFVSSTTLQAAVPATALSHVENASVTVQNPNSAPGTAAAATLLVTGPKFSLTSISPAFVAQGRAATINVTGTGFTPTSSVLWNGSPRSTVFISTVSLRAALTAADLQNTGTGQISVNNPGTDGSTTAAQTLTIVAPPVITSVNPTSIPVNTANNASATVTVTGTNFAANASLLANGVSLAVSSQSSTQIIATVARNLLYTSQALSVVVSNPAGTTAAIWSQPATLNIINPTAAFSVTPNSVPIGSPDTKINIYGPGFFADSVVQWNGTPLATTYSSSYNLTAIVPAALVSTLGNAIIGVSTPENLGQDPPTQVFSTYLAMPVNDIAWNATDGLIYATISGTAGPGLGNSLIGIDPNTGVVQKTIFVGSEPNRLAISSDGTQAFVGLNNAGSVRQVNLVTGIAGIQFSLGGGAGIYNPPYSASNLAAVPGQPNSVAVYSTGGIVTIYDAGVARANTSTGLQTYFSSNYGGLAFGPSASTLYVSSEAIGSYVYALTVDNTGITSSTRLSTSGGGNTLQYDAGRLYFPNGVVANAATGASLGQFSIVPSYSSSAVAVSGPVVSDSASNRAWVVPSNYSQNNEIVAYDETTFNPVSTLPIGGIGANNSIGMSNPADLIRWGQGGLAFHTAGQLYIEQGSIVKDMSGSPVDLQVTGHSAATATTGTGLSYQFQVKNLGPNDANGVTLTVKLPGSVIYGAVTTTAGSCNGDGTVYCDLGALTNGSTATITATITPTEAGSIQTTALVQSQSFDSDNLNNQVTVTTPVTGTLYSPVPSISLLSPNAVAAGAPTFTLTVNGSNFTTASSVEWNGTVLPTTFVNSGQLTASVDASLVTQLGWGLVSVSSTAPGGGNSSPLTLTIYSLLSVPANAIVYDPFTRKLWAALPSTSTTITGNSLVSLEPTTGIVGQPILVGSEPNLLAETSSGNYLYLGLSGAKSLGRFNMLTKALDLTVPLTTTGFGAGPVAATGLATLPGVDTSISVANVGILDIAGSTAIMRPNSALGYNDAVFPDASHAYTYDNGSTGAEFYRYTVDSNGVHLIDGTTLLGMGGFSGGFALDGGLAYGNGGGIFNPSTVPPSQIGVLPLGGGPYGIGLYGGGVVPYAAEQKSFNIAINSAGTWLTFIERFDTEHLVLEDQISVPSTAILTGVNGTRWGQDGLAYLITGGLGGSAPSQILLVRGPFVLPMEATVNATPTLTAAAVSTLAVGSGNSWLTISGTGFMPGASVLSNGVVHDTRFVDSQHLKVAIGASEVSAAGTINLSCRNPGSNTSNSVAVTIK